MKIILAVGGSRAGLEFFLSLLDGHTEILQFPGTIRGNKKLIHILSHNNSSDISSNFIKNYQHFFDSRLSTFERHNMLGDDKNQYYLVDKEKFKKNFFEIYKNRQKSLMSYRKNTYLKKQKQKSYQILNYKIVIFLLKNMTQIKK